MEFIFSFVVVRLPETATGYFFEITLGFLAAIVFASFFEYFAHRYIMHHRPPLLGDIPVFREQLKRHAVLHHGAFYKQFTHEDDPIGRDISITFSLKEMLIIQACLLPFVILIAFIAPVIALCFPLVAISHNLLWNIIHQEMHQPEKGTWTRWSIYRFLARHHFLHHQHTEKNFNVVFPLADFVLAASAKPTHVDRTEMDRLGYF